MFAAPAATVAAQGPSLPRLLGSRAKEIVEVTKTIPFARVIGAHTEEVELCWLERGESTDTEGHIASRGSSPLPHVAKRLEQLERAKLLQFMQRNGFQDVNSSSGWFFNYRYPLHTAVEQNDADMVSLLLQYKARSKRKDFNGRTAKQLAQHLNVSGSHAAVLMVFQQHKMARRRKIEGRRAEAEKLVEQCTDDPADVPRSYLGQ